MDCQRERSVYPAARRTAGHGAGSAADARRGARGARRARDGARGAHPGRLALVARQRRAARAGDARRAGACAPAARCTACGYRPVKHLPCSTARRACGGDGAEAAEEAAESGNRVQDATSTTKLHPIAFSKRLGLRAWRQLRASLASLKRSLRMRSRTLRSPQTPYSPWRPRRSCCASAGSSRCRGSR